MDIFVNPHSLFHSKKYAIHPLKLGGNKSPSHITISNSELLYLYVSYDYQNAGPRRRAVWGVGLDRLNDEIVDSNPT
jgi:hypothetical protein